jgi:hypothetical protein
MPASGLFREAEKRASTFSVKYLRKRTKNDGYQIKKYHLCIDLKKYRYEECEKTLFVGCDVLEHKLRFCAESGLYHSGDQ